MTDEIKHEPLLPLPLPAVTGPWSHSNATYLAGRAALDPADQIAGEMESKWGCGALRLFCSAELRERFDRQRLKLNHAVWHGTLPDVQREAARMITAYQRLDQEAHRLGAKRLDPRTMETVLADGSVAVVVENNMAAHDVVTQDRRCHVYTLEEIARLIDGYPGLAKIKHSFPGSTVTAVRRSVTDPLDGTLPIADEEIPL